MLSSSGRSNPRVVKVTVVVYKWWKQNKPACAQLSLHRPLTGTQALDCTHTHATHAHTQGCAQLPLLTGSYLVVPAHRHSVTVRA
eukprot:1160213-Pelagomonas_calceolata.AAC.2